jgi:hypothetical protein
LLTLPGSPGLPEIQGLLGLLGKPGAGLLVAGGWLSDLLPLGFWGSRGCWGAAGVSAAGAPWFTGASWFPGVSGIAGVAWRADAPSVVFSLFTTAFPGASWFPWDTWVTGEVVQHREPNGSWCSGGIGTPGTQVS